MTETTTERKKTHTPTEAIEKPEIQNGELKYALRRANPIYNYR